MAENGPAMIEQRLRDEIVNGPHYGELGAWKMWLTPAGREGWRRRVDLLRRRLRPGMSVLEIGCGTGLFTRDLAKTGARVVAIDISPELVERARREVPEPTVEFRVDNAYDLDAEDRTFDAVVGSSVLHHLDVGRALAEFRRVLRPGGVLALSEPNMANPIIFLQKNVPLLKRLAGDTPDETAFVSWSLQRRLERAGFEDVTVAPYNFLHPVIPGPLIGWVDPLCRFLERIPVAREIAGSLFVEAWVQRRPVT